MSTLMFRGEYIELQLHICNPDKFAQSNIFKLITYEYNIDAPSIVHEYLVVFTGGRRRLVASGGNHWQPSWSSGLHRKPVASINIR